ncbi:McrC family protein [Geothrix terrae]|uniref:McrC family protein n=1 Tax=Geothrix terrae TaxID=2922720 RepID=UPI001FAC100F|nr:McrC family protein [Geothrix terrae]
MIKVAKEGEITWFSGLGPLDMPEPLPKGISLHIGHRGMGVEVQGLVGALPLRNGDTLHIIPKISKVNFLRLLFKSEGIQPDLEREYESFVSYSVENEENIDSIVARQLILSISEILKRSPKQGRVRVKKSGTFAIGQLDVVETALNISCHSRDPIVYTVSEKTSDIPENRIITEAVIRALPLLKQADLGSLSGVYEKWLKRFNRSQSIRSDLEYIERGFASELYGGPRDYYRKALMLSKVVLGNNGLGYGDVATLQGDAILMQTATVFEKYLRNIISDRYIRDGYIVVKGGLGKTTLYTNGSFELDPDIVVYRNGVPLLIADAKYKEPTIDDHYQMHAYLTSNNLKRGLILAPLYTGGSVVSREYITPQGILVTTVFLPMSNLSVTEEYLGTVVERFA